MAVCREDVLVYDFGSGNIRAGFSGNEQPVNIVPTPLAGTDKCAVKRGIVEDWDAVEAIAQDAAKMRLGVDISNHPVLVADSVTTLDKDREKMAEMFIEKFNAPAYFVGYQPVLSVFSCGRTSSIVIDSGYGVSHAVAVHEGFAFPHTIQRLDFGGADMTEYLKTMLGDKGVNVSLEVAEQMKIDIGRVPLDFAQESMQAKSTPTTSNATEAVAATNGDTITNQQTPDAYKLPDGTVIDVREEQLRCGEAMFQPALMGRRGGGIADVLWDIVNICESDSSATYSVLKALPQFILMVGGSCLTPNLDQRLTKEIIGRSEVQRDVYVSSLHEPERHHAAWVGGSLLGSLPAFVENNFVSKEEYNEIGASAVSKRCC